MDALLGLSFSESGKPNANANHNINNGDSAAVAEHKLQQQQTRQQGMLLPRFTHELDGGHCFETIVPS